MIDGTIDVRIRLSDCFIGLFLRLDTVHDFYSYLGMCGAPFYKECQTRLLNLCKTHCVPTASPVGLFWTCVIYCRPIIDSFPWLGGEYNTPLILISGCVKKPIFPQTPYRGQPA